MTDRSLSNIDQSVLTSRPHEAQGSFPLKCGRGHAHFGGLQIPSSHPHLRENRPEEEIGHNDLK